MRLPSELCGVALCMVTAWIVGRLTTPRCGLYAGLAMPVCGLFIELGRVASYDMPLALGVGVATLAATRNLVLRHASLGWWMLAYAGLVFGFLAKGLPAVGIFGPGLLMAALALRQFRKLFAWQHLVGAALAGLAVGIYLYLAYRQEGVATFGDQYAEISHRSAQWNAASVVGSLLKPVIIWAAFLPGSALVPFLLARSRPRMPLGSRRLARALACFFLTSVVVWMLVPTNKTRYYLPLITPVAGLAGLAAEGLSPNAFRPRRNQIHRRDAWAAGWGQVSSRVRGVWADYKPGMIVMLFGLLCWAINIMAVEPRKAAARSERAVAAAFAPHLNPQEKIYVDTFDGGSSLFYYLGHPVGRWCHTGWPVASSFAVAVIDEQRLELLNRTDLQVDILASRRTGIDITWSLARVTHLDPGSR
jgi:hypothetical protein